MTNSNASFTLRAAQYADDVLSGAIPACNYVKLACQRFVNDLERDDIELTDDGEKWCRFLEKLPHTKGKWAAKREKFKLSPYQIFCTVNIYGWKRVDTDKRRFAEVYIEVPRKNGKTFWLACLGVAHMCIDGEFGGEIYCGATSEKQAWEVFRPAKQICERTPELTAKFDIEVHAQNLSRVSDGTKFEPVIGNPGDGSSPSVGIADEYHEHKTSDLVDTFVTGMGARDEPIMYYITTAGADIGGPCYAKRDDVIKILEGSAEDDRVYGIIYTLDEDDEWNTEDAQIKANPNYGVSVNADFLAGQLKGAMRSATKQAAYKTKHLNLWVGAMAAWLNMLAYQRCRKKLDIEELRGRECIASVDLATKSDIACLGLLFPPKFDNDPFVFLCKHYLPEDTVLEGDNTRYKAWHADGWLTATPGNVTDYSFIEDDIEEIAKIVRITTLGFDPYQANQFSTRMYERGYDVVSYGANVKNFSEPMKLLESLILEKKRRAIHFDMDPVLMWMFSNVVAKIDAKDNIFPNKQVAANKIDGVVTAIMCLGLWFGQAENRSPYQDRGLLTL